LTAAAGSLAFFASSKRCSRSYKIASASQSSDLSGRNRTVSSANETARAKSPNALHAIARPCAKLAEKPLPAIADPGGRLAMAESKARKACCGRRAAISA
jgi:hypothetical protein